MHLKKEGSHVPVIYDENILVLNSSWLDILFKNL